MSNKVNPAIDKAMQSVTAATARADADPTRPLFHFRPPAFWMNDPNGPIYHNGWFHLFYQHNPYGDEWGHMHWGHARSRDLVRWEHLPIALPPSLELGEEHVFSGCAWRNGDGEPLLFYTSVKAGPRESRPPNEQWAARPLDADLITWEKHPANPILALETHGGPHFDSEWRDPFIFAEAGRTFMVVGGDVEDVAGVGLYEAADASLLKWHYRGLLVQTTKDKLRFYECPNFVKVDGKWILLTSPYRQIEYMVGDFDLETLTFTVEQEGVLDPGFSDVPNFYASNILFDEAGRCILLGWVRGFAKERGWNGALALPRILSIGDDGHPRQQPIPELAQLRGPVTDFGAHQLCDDSAVEYTSAAPSVEVEATLKLSKSADVGLVLNGQPLVEYRAIEGQGKLNVADTEVALPLNEDGLLKLQVFIDRSVVELFANDGQIAVTRIIDTPTDRCQLKFYSRGPSCEVRALRVWQMQSAW
ncbi:MAG: glycoside hydrolase family 32 protein [Caldilineaceae bacterium]